MTWLVLLPLDVDPNVVKPGWTPLLITVLLALAMIGLFVSMRRQFRKIEARRASGEYSQDGDGEVDSEPRRAAGPTA